MKTKLIFKLFLFAVIPVFLSCNILTEEISLSKATLDLPSSINEPETRSITRSESPLIINALKHLYDPIREEYNPMASQAIDYIKNILLLIDENIFHSREIMTSLIRDNFYELPFTDDNSTENMLRVTRNENDYEVEMWKKAESAWIKYLNIAFTVNRDNLNGIIYLSEPSLVQEKNVLYKIIFNTDDSCGHSLELSAINLDYSEGADLSENIADRLWLKICKSSNSFYISANVHYTHVNLGNSTGFDDYVMAQLYDGSYIPGTTVVNANYIYSGAVNLTNGNGAVSLALVPESDNSTSEIFDEYSIGNIYKEAIVEWIKEATDTESGKPLIQVINDVLNQAEENIISVSSSSDEIFTALGQVQSYLETHGNTDNSTLKEILFVVKLVNPGYFEKDNGFIGNDLINTPAWADLVPDFHAFPIKSAAELSGDSFIFEMPNDNPPDP